MLHGVVADHAIVMQVLTHPIGCTIYKRSCMDL